MRKRIVAVYLPVFSRVGTRFSRGASRATRAVFRFVLYCVEGNGVARAFAAWVRGGHSMAFSGGQDEPATPPQGPPRVEKGGSSQNSKNVVCITRLHAVLLFLEKAPRVRRKKQRFSKSLFGGS